MRYRLIVMNRAERGLKRLPTVDRERVAIGIDGLLDDPRPQSSRQLRGHLSHLRRLRVGYEIDEEAGLVIIRAIGPRGNFYERLQRSH